MVDQDTWARYTAAIRAEFWDTREAANAQLKLRQLCYKGDIKVYFTEFRTLNVYARATGVELREKIDQSMTDNILDMHFAHYMEEFIDDENFLVVTYNARPHGTEKCLKSGPRSAARKRDGMEGRPGRKKSRQCPKGQGVRWPQAGWKPDSGGKAEKLRKSWAESHWGSGGNTYNGVPQNEIDAHRNSKAPRTATPEQRSRAQSYRKTRSRQAQSNGKGKGVKMPRSLQPPNKPNPDPQGVAQGNAKDRQDPEVHLTSWIPDFVLTETKREGTPAVCRLPNPQPNNDSHQIPFL